MNLFFKIILIVFSSLITLIVLAWIGLQVQPASFPAFAQTQRTLETIPFPVGLPAPVARFYRKLSGTENELFADRIIRLLPTNLSLDKCLALLENALNLGVKAA